MAKRILIIDDDRGTLALLRSLLTGNGYEVVEACDGDEGLDILADQGADLVILDIQMPKLNGYNFIVEMKKNAAIRNVPVIVVTAKEAMADMFEVEGVKEYLVKPVDNANLLEKVAKHIR
jgi:DNA-binding response OmpR family regulator